MKRFEFEQTQKESEYLNQVIAKLESDPSVFEYSQHFLTAVAHQEPLIAESLYTPQDVIFHAEGSTMRDHLRLMLMFLYALVEGKVSLLDIEEFRRLKGYEGNLQELENLIKEYNAFFQVFTLGHDIAKWVTITFTAEPGSRGEVLGFNTPRSHHFDEIAHERYAKRSEYLALYKKFRQEYQGTDRETQVQFYLHYGIRIHYPGHARKIYAPVFHAFVRRLSQAHRLTPNDSQMLEDLISHHMEFGSDFTAPHAKRVERYRHLASKRRYEADHFLHLAQACLLLDQTIGSRRWSSLGYWHETKPFVNFLQSEHDFAPHKRAEKEALREAQGKKERQKLFRDVGLDGIAMMDVLNMESGFEFGLALRRIHAGILGQGEMPRFDQKIDAEIQKRAEAYYKKIFEKGD